MAGPGEAHRQGLANRSPSLSCRVQPCGQGSPALQWPGDRLFTDGFCSLTAVQQGRSLVPCRRARSPPGPTQFRVLTRSRANLLWLSAPSGPRP